MKTLDEEIRANVIRKYAVTYVFTGRPDSEWGAKFGATNQIVFDHYDVNNFQSYAPKNWEITVIERIYYPDR